MRPITVTAGGDTSRTQAGAAVAKDRRSTAEAHQRLGLPRLARETTEDDSTLASKTETPDRLEDDLLLLATTCVFRSLAKSAHDPRRSATARAARRDRACRRCCAGGPSPFPR